jgi:hypothetical protein
MLCINLARNRRRGMDDRVERAWPHRSVTESFDLKTEYVNNISATRINESKMNVEKHNII